MALSPGTRLGVYEVTAQIGAGGMGEVYRATDSNLKRSVAIKVLPASVAGDTDRLARFQREAEVLAALNHPNIAAIYGLEKTKDFTALVMELVEGEDLSEKIGSGLKAHGSGLPMDEALNIARQIAEALEAAHEQGIIHRDLKPANIKVRSDGTVKVLDFGLAKTLDSSSRLSSNASMSPTITSPAMTQAGMIVGTASYMSPEQAKGRVADKRSDVWAFGCVLYEMLTGTRAFPGDDVVETLAAVLKTDPDFTLLPASLPPAVPMVLRRCLQRDRSQRIRDIGDVRLAIEGAFEMPASSVPTPSVPVRRFWRQPAWLAMVIGALAIGLLAGRLLPSRTAATSSTRLHLALNVPPSDRLVTASQSFALSPDGLTLVYTAVRAGVQQLYRRSFSEPAPVAIAGTTGADVPFFSPDGKWLGFTANHSLKKMTLPDGVPVSILDWDYRIYEASWEDDGNVVFVTNIAGDAVHIVPAAGGTVIGLLRRNDGGNDRYPEALPEQRGVLFQHGNNVFVHPRSGDDKIVVSNAQWARYIPSGPLLFSRGGTIFAAPFDLDRLVTTREPVPVIADVSARPSIGGGTLVYRTGDPTAGRTLAWVDRSGHAEPIPLEACLCQDPQLSPDGNRIALAMRHGNTSDIYVLDRGRAGMTQLTVNAAATHPSWTPDGRRIGFTTSTGDARNLAWRAADGTGPVETIVSGNLFESSWAPDGRLLIVPVPSETSGDIMLLAHDGKGPAVPLVKTPQFDYAPRVSPNGKWLVYVSVETGQPEVYVRPFPNVKDGSWKVSTNGGRDPHWSHKGDELFYTNDGSMFAVPVETASTFAFSSAKVLFSGDYVWSEGRHSFDVAPDGRFLMMKDVPGAVTIQVALDWLDELKARVR